MEPTPPGPTPIPVEGEVQIFADPGCTSYPSGVVDTVYARVNVSWGFEESWGTPEFAAMGPYTGGESEPYYMLWYSNFASTPQNMPYSVGTVVPLVSSEGAIDVSDFIFIFP